MRPLALAALLIAPLLHRTASAQDFAAPAPAGPGARGATLIERALPDPERNPSLEALAVQWGGLADFTTRAAVASSGFGPARIAAGISSTGSAELGWNSVALGAGIATPSWGAGLRAVGRRDRSSPAGPASRAIGSEAGAGFWTTLSRGAMAWASLPTIYTAGESPPLDRGLESGVRLRSGALCAWLGWSAPARSADAGERLAGVDLESGALMVWLEARDRPLRATLGVRARLGTFDVAASSSEHPVLGETVRLEISAHRNPARAVGGVRTSPGRPEARAARMAKRAEEERAEQDAERACPSEALAPPTARAGYETLPRGPERHSTLHRPAPDVAPDAVWETAAPDSTLDDGNPLREPEPPEEVPEGQDFESERRDSLERGVVEVGYQLSQRGGAPLRRRERLSMTESGFEAQVREGRADALSGGAVGARIPGGVLTAGRASPRWGRGLLMGVPDDPIRDRPGSADAPRSRAGVGDGIEYRSGERLDLIAQRVRHTTLVGASFARGGSGLGVAASRSEARTVSKLASAWTARGAGAGELAMDMHGRWRSEGRLAPSRESRLGFAVRFGHESFEGAVPARSPRPAVALGGAWRSAPAPLTLDLSGALWRFRAGLTGARGTLEVRAVLPQHDLVAVGFEERHGLTRLTSGTPRNLGFRQGGWLALNRGGPRITMTIRQELWGSRSGLRGVTRRVASAGFTAHPIPACEVGISAAVFRVRSSEPQYLSEDDVERRVLRALTGAGQRTRVHLGFPAAGGSLRAALTLAETSGRASPPQWTLDWTRRARTH